MTENPRMDKWLKEYEENKYGNSVGKVTSFVPAKAEREVVYHYDAVPGKTFHYAGFWRRLFAFTIDSVLLSLLLFEIDNFFYLLFFYSLYYAVMTSSPLRGTVGKLAIGAVVVDTDGNRISFVRALLRYLGYLLSGIIFFIGFLMIAFHGKKKALHDMVCGTIVINK